MRRLIMLALTVLMLATCMGTSTAYAEEELVIVLDPGHDATHGGATGNGIREERAVLKIGLYLREELSKYQNVTVYMVREGEACAFPETHKMPESSKRCNEARVAYAESMGADVIVSLHLNYYSGPSARGALVLVQNSNYDANAGAISQNLGRSIVKKLAELGLANGGIVTKNLPVDPDPNEYCYEDGSVADYYRVLRYAKKVHIPALIVEHAFISSNSDVAKVLSTEEGLKALALKDAEGIVEYYGLTLKEGCVAGELPDLSSIPGTETKPTLITPPQPTPAPQPEPAPEPVPETEAVTEVFPEETETEMLPEETETQRIPEETEEPEEASTNGEKVSWKTIVIVSVLAVAVAIGGFAAAQFFKNRTKKNK